MKMRAPGLEQAAVVTMETRVLRPLKRAFLCIHPECLTACKIWRGVENVCIVDCIRVKAHKFNRVSKQETLGLKPWHTKHVKCFYSDHVNRLGWMIEVLSFAGTKLYSQLPSPPRMIDKNQPFAPPPPQDWLTSNFSLQYHLWITHGGHENRGNIQPPKKFLTV